MFPLTTFYCYFPSNLGSGKANVPGSTIENHGPLLAGTLHQYWFLHRYQSDSHINRIHILTPILRRRYLELVRWIMTSYFMMTLLQLRHHEFQIKVRYSVFLHISLFYQCLSKTTKMSLLKWCSNDKRQKCRFGAERVKV